ncbi:hypothetical protein EGW08_019045 [Elysia chlorotica]|uniref:Uncharacterized protein n=1 Tax=Elysia chlorotica TaxID=188477 RepID=A0A433SVD1_ELYCH|nr:hypothetical protein EGW08_019045 [Elysia chlorotica]
METDDADLFEESFDDEKVTEDVAVDEVAHEKLLNSLFAIDGKKRIKNNVRGISIQSGNFDLAVHSKRNEGKIKPQDLKLKGRDSSGNLKKPMSSMETEQAKRLIARETMKTEMTTWEPIVQEIRAAPQMIFSNRPHGVEMREAVQPSRFKPRSTLEKELFAALGQSEDVLNPNKELTKAEERALKAMSIKDAMAKRAELMRHQELLSRVQIRAKRVKKIKSKRYRKIMRKEKETAQRKELEKLQQTDPEAFVERLEQIDKSRMEERLTLKHRGGGKFSRLHKVYSKFDDATKDAMQEMLQKSRELTKKTENVSSSEDEEEEVPTLPEKSAGVDSDSDNEDETRTRKKHIETLKAINNKAGGWLSGSKSTFVYVDEHLPSQEPEALDLQEEKPTGSLDVLSPEANETEEKQSNSQDQSEQQEKVESSDIDTMVEDTTASDSKKTGRKQRKRKKRKADDTKSEDIQAQKLAKTKEGSVKEVFLETPLEEEAGEEEQLENDRDGDDSMVVTMEELFQDEDVVEQFSREKLAAEAKAGPKFEDTKLPGWGCWSGPDYKEEKRLTKKQKRAEAKAKLHGRREDKVKQPHVWLNPQRDDSVRKLQPKTVPFPYSSLQQYEASLRQPVSRDFVRETAFKLLTKPEVVTKLGHVIKPMNKEEVFKKKIAN